MSCSLQYMPVVNKITDVRQQIHHGVHAHDQVYIPCPAPHNAQEYSGQGHYGNSVSSSIYKWQLPTDTL
jgi:hypothetical protein